MEINKKVLIKALSQIKSYKDVILIKDSLVDGCLDILYGVKCGKAAPRCINKITIRINGLVGNDLFDDDPADKLGESILVYQDSIKRALVNADVCILKDGCVNGIRVEVDKSDLTSYSVRAWLINRADDYLEELKKIPKFESITLQKIDYTYMVSECSKFVLDDPSRQFMSGICFNFINGGTDLVHIVATNGRGLCLLKLSAVHSVPSEDSGLGEYIIPSEFLYLPNSDYNSARIELSGKYGRVSISTEDYYFEGTFECIEGQYPNYLRVIPEVTENTSWFTLCAASFKMTIESVKNLMGKHGEVYLDAEKPDNLYITVEDTDNHGYPSQSLAVEGTASRPMHISFLWKYFSPCLFDGLPLTKFYLNGSNKAIITHEARAVKGLTLDVTKLVMPTMSDDYKQGYDEFRILLSKESENDSLLSNYLEDED